MAKLSREPRITWKIEEYSHREKGPDWYWALGVIALAGATIAIVFHDAFFAVFIILAALILGFYAAREPEIIEIAISDEGITIKNYFYAFAKLKGFAVDENELGNHLLVETERMVSPIISIALPLGIDPDALRNFLQPKLAEKPIKEQISHRIMEHMGF